MNTTVQDLKVLCAQLGYTLVESNGGIVNILGTQESDADYQYTAALRKVYHHGTDTYNERTGQMCRVIMGHTFNFDASTDAVPLISTRHLDIGPIIAEMLGYWKGFTSAAQFKDLGTSTWNANANKTVAWLANSHRKGLDDLGMVYGAVAQNWPTHNGQSLDLFKKVYENLAQGIDDRGELITYWNPGLFELGCLRPCMFQHHFMLDTTTGTLHLESYSRSMDLPLGGPANLVQAWLMLKLMAHITGHRAGRVNIRVANMHIYGNQLPLVPLQLYRVGKSTPTLTIDPAFMQLQDVIDHMTLGHFTFDGYVAHPKIKYPFSS